MPLNLVKMCFGSLSLVVLCGKFNSFVMDKFVRVAAPVQRFKSVNLRDCFERMSHGIPINATMHQLHDLPDGVDMDSNVYDENADPLEVRQAMFDDYEFKQQEKAAKQEKASIDEADKGKNPLKEKGGIENETSPYETPQES